MNQSWRVRFVALPMFITGLAVMLVPFWPVRVIGALVVLTGLVVQYGARTTRKKARLGV